MPLQIMTDDWQLASNKRRGRTTANPAPTPKTRFPTSYKNPFFSIQSSNSSETASTTSASTATTLRSYRKREHSPRSFFKPARTIVPPPPPPTNLLPSGPLHRGPKRIGAKLAGLHLGILKRHGHFAAEYDTNLADGHLEISDKFGFLLITGDAFEQGLSVRIVLSFDSLEAFFVDGKNLVIRLGFAPSYEVYQSVKDVMRVTAYNLVHRQLTPFTSRHLLLTFANATQRDGFFERALKLPLPRPIYKTIPITHQNLFHYSIRSLINLRARWSHIDPRLAFQLEAFLHAGLLLPSEFDELEELLSLLLNAYTEEVTEMVLVELRRNLLDDRFERERREVVLGQKDGVASSDEGNKEVEISFCLEDHTERARVAVVERRAAIDLVHDESHFLVRHVLITPTGIMFDGPTVEQGNSIVRKHPGAVDNLVRVCFLEEDRTRLQVGRWGISKAFLFSHVYSPLSTALEIGGRAYSFLAFSQSGLRQHSAWMVTDYEDPSRFVMDEDGDPVASIVTAEEIRTSLGDFRKLSATPSLYGARLSQGFTSSRGSISIRAENITTIPDIVVLDNLGNVTSNHTDGAGLMSAELRNVIWHTMLDSGHNRDRLQPPPSVFQSRLGGNKARDILVVDDRLHGRQLQLRPSNRKFKATFDDDNARSFQLHIAEAFSRPGMLYLNRPLISALDDLGVKAEAFLDVQQVAITELTEDRKTFIGARRLLNRYGFGAGTRLQNLMSSLDRLDMPSSLLIDDDFLRGCLDVATSRVLRDFKMSMRIPLPERPGTPGSYNLVGVPDLDDILEPHQIYCAVRDRDRVVTYIKGQVAVTRSPTLDAGDIRLLDAIGKLPDDSRLRIKALFNCIVFSTRGDRAVTSQMGGGDLDGDQYNLIRLPSIIPEKTIPPRPHTAVPHHRLNRACTIDDLAACFASFIQNDTTGAIATRHLWIADASPLHGEDSECKVLADLYSQAVDFAKSGVPVPISVLKRRDTARPDFLHQSAKGHGVYESQRALGRLYRAVDDSQIQLPDLLIDPLKTDPNFVRDALLQVAQQLFDFVQPLLPPEDDDDDDAPPSLRLSFCGHLQHLGEIHNHPRKPGTCLSELEVFVGTNLVSDPRDARGRKNAVIALQNQSGQLVDAVEKAWSSGRTLGQKFTAVWEDWEKAKRAMRSTPRDDLPFGTTSWSWMCVAVLLETLELIEVFGHDAKADDEGTKDHLPTTRSTSHSGSTPPTRVSTPGFRSTIVRPKSEPGESKASRKKARARQVDEFLRQADALSKEPRPATWDNGSDTTSTATDDWGTTDWSSSAVPSSSSSSSSSSWGSETVVGDSDSRASGWATRGAALRGGRGGFGSARGAWTQQVPSTRGGGRGGASNVASNGRGGRGDGVNRGSASRGGPSARGASSTRGAPSTRSQGLNGSSRSNATTRPSPLAPVPSKTTAPPPPPPPSASGWGVGSSTSTPNADVGGDGPSASFADSGETGWDAAKEETLVGGWDVPQSSTKQAVGSEWDW